MVTRLGDVYDHSKDILVLGMTLALIQQLRGFGWYWLVLAALALSSAIQTGLVEAYNEHIEHI